MLFVCSGEAILQNKKFQQIVGPTLVLSFTKIRKLTFLHVAMNLKSFFFSDVVMLKFCYHRVYMHEAEHGPFS